MKDFIILTDKKGRKYILSPDRSYEYTAKVKGRGEKIVLKYSNIEAWANHVRGKKAATLKDTGNGITINFEDSSLALGYSDFAILCALVKLKMQSDPDLM